MRLPLLQKIPVPDICDVQHLQKADLIRDLAVGELVDPIAAQLPGHLHGQLCRHAVKGDNIRLAAVLIHAERAAEAVVGLNEIPALVRQELLMPISKQKIHLIIDAVRQIAVDSVVIQDLRVGAQHHVHRQRTLFGVGMVGRSAAEYVEQVSERRLMRRVRRGQQPV